MPAALRISDLHVCPKSEGSVPHVGGPAGPVPIVTDVLVDGLPAAVVGDACMCVGPPDRITAGIEGVVIGGRLAADSAAATEHGGRFVIASPDVEFG